MAFGFLFGFFCEPCDAPVAGSVFAGVEEVRVDVEADFGGEGEEVECHSALYICLFSFIPSLVCCKAKVEVRLSAASV